MKKNLLKIQKRKSEQKRTGKTEFIYVGEVDTHVTSYVCGCLINILQECNTNFRNLMACAVHLTISQTT